jgi:hypothetical protein
MLFFQETFQSLESLQYGFSLHQLWFRLSVIILCGSPLAYEQRGKSSNPQADGVRWLH